MQRVPVQLGVSGTFSDANRLVSVSGANVLKESRITDGVSGNVLTVAAALTGTRTWTGVDASDTFAFLGQAQTFTAAQTINTGSGSLPAALPNVVLRLAAAAAVIQEGIAAGGVGLALSARAAGGTWAGVAATDANRNILNLAAYGHDGTAWKTTPSAVQRILNGAGAWSGTNQESIWTWEGTPNNSITRAEWMRLQGGASEPTGLGALCIGTTLTTGNGLLQLASGTTKANGIAWGTDCFLYRDSASSMTMPNMLTIDLGTGALPSALGNTTLRMANPDGAGIRLETFGFRNATGTVACTLTGRLYGGTRASASATVGGDSFFQLTAFGSETGANSLRGGAYVISAGSNWSGTNHETYHWWEGCASTSTSNVEWMRLQGGCLTLSGGGVLTPTIGNGLLQFASGTTKANGVAWGTDCFLYRDSASSMTMPNMLTIDLGTGALPTPNSGVCFRIAQVDASPARAEFLGFGSTGFAVIGRSTGGTRASQTATPADQAFFSFNAQGHDGTSLKTTTAAFIAANADGLWAAGNNGAYIRFAGTPNGSTSNAEWMRLQGGSLLIGTSTFTSGNGLLQLVSGTTKANGIAFGTDCFFFRNGANSAIFQSSSGNAQISVYESTGVDGLQLFCSTSNGICGTVGSVPLLIRTNGITAATVDTSQGFTFAGKAVSTAPTAGVGYATGAGGTITQGTSRSTGVTLNTVTGAITLFSAAGSTTPTTFTVTNSAVAATDTVLVVQKSGTDLYHLNVTAVAAGSFNLTFFTTGGTTTEQPVFSFTVIKGVTS